jgi:hypothetical protein
VLEETYMKANDMNTLTTSAPGRRAIIRGCLHLGVDVSRPGRNRQVVGASATATARWDWSADAAGDPIEPVDTPYSNQLVVATPPIPASPWPDAIRVTLITAGGGRKVTPGQDPAAARYATRGFLAQEITDQTAAATVRLGGIKTLPVGQGAVLRLGDPNDASSTVEWVGYTAFRNGLLEGVTRGALRTGTEVTPGGPGVSSVREGYAFPRNTPVAVGRIHRLVRTLPP